VEALLTAASHASVCRLAAKSGPAGARLGPTTGGVGVGAAAATSYQSYGSEGGAGAVDCLVEMRMLVALRDACQLAGGAAAGAPTGTAAGVRGMLLPADGTNPRVGGAGGRVDASLDRTTALEPLLALRCAALAALGRPRERAAALVAAVKAARRSGATAAGLAAVQVQSYRSPCGMRWGDAVSNVCACGNL
jgi:hypothetical protein